jgi:hypothetical protein
MRWRGGWATKRGRIRRWRGSPGTEWSQDQDRVHYCHGGELQQDEYEYRPRTEAERYLSIVSPAASEI